MAKHTHQRRPLRPVQWLDADSVSLIALLTASPDTLFVANILASGVSLATLLNESIYTVMRIRGTSLIHPLPFYGATDCTPGTTVRITQAIGVFQASQAAYPDLETNKSSQSWLLFDQRHIVLGQEYTDGGALTQSPDIWWQLDSKAMRRVEKTFNWDLIWKCQMEVIAGTINNAAVQVSTGVRVLVKT